MIARRRLGGFAIAVMVALIAVCRAAPALDRGATYANPRFGTIADYPADLLTVQDPPPENGDGASFRTADGGRAPLHLWRLQCRKDTPQSYLANIDAFEGATYKRVTPQFYAVSGASGADIYYARCNFPPHNDDILNCFHITYPAREKALWDPIVTRISKSLRPGQHG